MPCSTTKNYVRSACSAFILCQLFNTTTAFSADFDIAINNGTVIDPATSTRKIANLGIKDGSIASISEHSLDGSKVIDATGQYVVPGFIDLHTHSPLPFGETLQSKDGVTTALDLEAGSYPNRDYGSFIRGKAHANYGSSVGHYSVRIKVIEGKDQPYIITELGALVPGKAFQQPATSDQIETMRTMLARGIDEGGIGIGVLLDYMTNAITDEELQMIFEVAKSKNSAVFIHIRRGVNGDIAPLMELIDMSKKTGAKVHICHINANAMGNIKNWLDAIDNANENGGDISAEVFPYTAGSTSISADVFNRDWQKIFDITYSDVQWAETGEYFTKESWEEKRKNRPDGMVIHHYMNEDWLKIGLQYPDMMVSTDAMPAANSKRKAAPNGSGSYTRLLAHYVRDKKILTIEEAIAKASYYPARRLESFAPAFGRKGRIQEGADADILIFDLSKIQDNATYEEPYKQSTGWSYHIVGGKITLEDGKQTGAVPGELVLSTQP